MKHARSTLQDNRGATMVETTICVLVVILFIGAVIDFGLGLWQYNYLHYTTGRAAREISAKLATTLEIERKGCDVVANVANAHLSQVAHREMVQAMQSGDAASWTWCMTSAGSSQCLNTNTAATYKTLQVVGTLPLNCYFLCTVVPLDWAVTSTVTAAIDHPGVPSCTGGPVPRR